MTMTENLVVEQRVLRCVECIRRLVIELPAHSVRDSYWVQRFANKGDEDYGPFSYEPIEGTEYFEPLSTRVIAVTKEVADVPYREDI